MKVSLVVARLWKEHRVSLLISLYNFNFYSYSFGLMNLILQKACFPEGPPGTNVVCNDTAGFKEYNTMNALKTTWRELLAGLVVLLCGSWRDQTGLSLPLILMPVIGDIIAAALVLISSTIWSFPIWATAIIDAICGIMGRRALVLATSLAYISEHVPPDQRAVKLVWFTAIATVGMSISSASGGFLLSILNYSGMNAMVIVIYLIIFASSFHVFRDNKPRNPSVIKPITILRNLTSVFVPRKNFFVIWVTLYSSFAFTGLIYAESAITLSFLQKVLSLNPKSVGLLQSYRHLTSLIMSLIATPVLINILKLTEFTVAILCTIPIALSSICMAFVSSLEQAYIFYAFDMMRMVLNGILWAILSKSVRKCELGIYVSFTVFGEAVTPLVISPLYAFIFNKTIDYFPGAFFIVSGFITLSITCLLIASSFYFEKIEEDDETEVKSIDNSGEDKENSECTLSTL